MGYGKNIAIQPTNHPKSWSYRNFEDRWENQLKSCLRGSYLTPVSWKDLLGQDIPGEARAWVWPKDPADLRAVLKFVCEKKIPWFIVGSGNHLIVRPGDFQGVGIQISQALSRIRLSIETADDLFLDVEAGFSCLRLASLIGLRNGKVPEEILGNRGTVGGLLWRMSRGGSGCLPTGLEGVELLFAEGTRVYFSHQELSGLGGTWRFPARAVLASVHWRFLKSIRPAIS